MKKDNNLFIYILMVFGAQIQVSQSPHISFSNCTRRKALGRVAQVFYMPNILPVTQCESTEDNAKLTQTSGLTSPSFIIHQTPLRKGHCSFYSDSQTHVLTK